MKNFNAKLLGGGLYSEVIDKLASSAVDKSNLNKTSTGRYIVSSMLGSFFVSFGIMLIYTIGGIMNHNDIQTYKILMGVCFGVALSLVIMAGGDLFTSNAMITTFGLFKKKIKTKDAISVLGISWIGNLLGGIVGGLLFVGAGLATGNNDYIGDLVVKNVITKTTLPWNVLLIRGILCNVLVCLAVWLANILKEETGKLIMIFWCLFTFITAGFEHSVANMSFLTMGYLIDSSSVTLSGVFHNLLWVSIGNYIGGVIFLAIPYYFITHLRFVKN